MCFERMVKIKIVARTKHPVGQVVWGSSRVAHQRTDNSNEKKNCFQQVYSEKYTLSDTHPRYDLSAITVGTAIRSETGCVVKTVCSKTRVNYFYSEGRVFRT